MAKETIGYKRPFEGLIDPAKLMDERDEALRLYHLAADEVIEKTKINQQFRQTLRIIGDEGHCRGCGATIFWVKNYKTNKRLPITSDGLNHFADCPKANNFRKGKK